MSTIARTAYRPCVGIRIMELQSDSDTMVEAALWHVHRPCRRTPEQPTARSACPPRAGSRPGASAPPPRQAGDTSRSEASTQCRPARGCRERPPAHVSALRSLPRSPAYRDGAHGGNPEGRCSRSAILQLTRQSGDLECCQGNRGKEEQCAPESWFSCS